MARADLRDLVQACRGPGDVVPGSPALNVDARVDDRRDTDLLGRTEDDSNVLVKEAVVGRRRDEADRRQQLAVLVGKIDEAEQLDVPVADVVDPTRVPGRSLARASLAG